MSSKANMFDDLLTRKFENNERTILQDLLPSEITNPEDLTEPGEDEVRETTERTKAALEKLINAKISSSLPVRHAEKVEDAQYIRYTPANQGNGNASGSQQRIIRIVETQKDPMEPPRFKINKKIPNAPPSPPPPVMHSPTRKLTVQQQQDWRIPPCISNWKNARGYTIPLDKRLAADGRGLQQTHINEKHAKLAEALDIAARKAREAVEMRAQMERKLAQKEKEKKEESLRQLAAKAREERAGFLVSYSDSDGEDDRDREEEANQREQIRREKEKERRREKNLSRAGAEKRSALKRERERDISEQVALGMANPNFNRNEVQFDQRLFNQNQGVGSGFGEDDDYAVYDKAWKSTSAVAQTIYRPSSSVAQDSYGDDLEDLKKNRFVPDKSFSGADSTVKRDGPVQFEKQQEEDPFGLDQFLSEVKKKRK